MCRRKYDKYLGSPNGVCKGPGCYEGRLSQPKINIKLAGLTCLHDRLLSVEAACMSRDKWEKTRKEKLGKIFALKSIRR